MTAPIDTASEAVRELLAKWGEHASAVSVRVVDLRALLDEMTRLRAGEGALRPALLARCEAAEARAVAAEKSATYNEKLAENRLLYTYEEAEKLRAAESRATAAEAKLATVRTEWANEANRADRAEANLRMVAIGIDGVWRWQGDGGDEPRSLSCPVVMSADTARKLAAAEAEVARLREALRDGVVGLRMTLQLPGPETGITRNVKVVADAMCGVLDAADREAHKAALGSEPAGGEVKADADDVTEALVNLRQECGRVAHEASGRVEVGHAVGAIDLLPFMQAALAGTDAKGGGT